LTVAGNAVSYKSFNKQAYLSLMHKSNKIVLPVFLLLFFVFTGAAQVLTVRAYSASIPGNTQTEKYLPLLTGKRVAVLTNPSGMIGSTSLVDTLLKMKLTIKKVFVPEHGFRGDADAGVQVPTTKDKKTGLPVISLYGKSKKPTAAQLADVDVVLYDIQDLGVRFYTYISTMSYMMEACAENKKKMIVLDRPNPNGFYIDGPVLEPEFKSFLGLHPVPIVYAMTCGEYAQMVNGEGWLSKGVKCDLTVIPMGDYDRSTTYDLPVKPSPNIPNLQAILLYPSLGLFEGTVMSLARGTPWPFQLVGCPSYPIKRFGFTPEPSSFNKTPRYVGKHCYGIDLRDNPYTKVHPRHINLEWLLQMRMLMRDTTFFESNFNYHAGNSELQKQVQALMPQNEIWISWEQKLAAFRLIRTRYLLYPDIVEH
jgi:uncharacterized protein YbbC (DUF1343 family)